MVSFRSEASAPSYRSASVQRHRRLEDSDLVAPVSSTRSTPQNVTDYEMEDEDFPDEDFDDLPLDELDGIIFHENTNITPQSDSSHRSRPQASNRTTANPSSFDRATKPQTLNGSGSRLGSGNSGFARPDKDKGQLAAVTSNPYLPSASSSSHDGGQFLTDDETVFMDEDMDSCFLTEMETGQAGLESTHGTTQEMARVSGSGRQERFENVNERPLGLCQSRLGIERAAIKTESADSKYRLTSQSPKEVKDIISIKTAPTFASAHSTTQGRSYTSGAIEVAEVSVGKDPQCDSSTVPALTLTSLPFTYLRLLQERISKQHLHTVEIRVKAFIVTLLGNLTSSNGVWRVCATISDGSGYLDVELSDEVLTGLLGFSVAEKAVLKRDPARRGELDAGMKRCQEALVDMCCVMTIVVEPQGKRAVVTKAEPVTEKVLQALEQRVRDRRK